jgi:hypothetical protein
MNVTQEPDNIDGRILVIGGLGFLALLLFGGLIAWLVERWADPSLSPATAHRSAGRAREVPEEVNGVRTSLFRAADPLLTRRDPERLTQYGWVDQQQQLVHIPIERAKQLYLERRRASALPSSAAGRGGTP